MKSDFPVFAVERHRKETSRFSADSWQVPAQTPKFYGRFVKTKHRHWSLVANGDSNHAELWTLTYGASLSHNKKTFHIMMSSNSSLTSCTYSHSHPCIYNWTVLHVQWYGVLHINLALRRKSLNRDWLNSWPQTLWSLMKNEQWKFFDHHGQYLNVKREVSGTLREDGNLILPWKVWPAENQKCYMYNIYILSIIDNFMTLKYLCMCAENPMLVVF